MIVGLLSGRGNKMKRHEKRDTITLPEFVPGIDDRVEKRLKKLEGRVTAIEKCLEQIERCLVQVEKCFMRNEVDAVLRQKEK